MRLLTISSCSYASFKTKDGHPFSVRTYDGTTSKNILMVSKRRGEILRNSTVSKYGFHAIVDSVKNITLDGLNSNGLSISSLGQKRAVYQAVPEGKEEQALLVHELGTYILGTCANVNEVKETLENFYVTGNSDTPLLSFTFCDAEGRQLFVEYVDGKPAFRKVENESGILTEDAEQSWMDQIDSQPKEDRNPSPIARFQRLAKAFREISIPENSINGRDFAFKLMDRVTIRQGEWVFPIEGESIDCYTQYTVVLEHKKQKLNFTLDPEKHSNKMHVFDVKKSYS